MLRAVRFASKGTVAEQLHTVVEKFDISALLFSNM